MKANKKSLMRGDESAQAGIGTLIIFIAMVLVAAVAAAVLIQTSGVLQEKAQSTGKQASEEVSSNLMIKSIEAVRANNDTENVSDTLDLLKLKVALNIGSSDVDLNQVVITITDGDTTNDLVYANNDKTHGTGMSAFDSSDADANLVTLLTGNGTPGNDCQYFFTVEKVRDEDESFSQESPVMNSGDLVTVYVSTVSSSATDYILVDGQDVSAGLKNSGLTIDSRTDVSLTLTPEMGGATTASFTAPATFNQKTIPLWP